MRAVLRRPFRARQIVGGVSQGDALGWLAEGLWPILSGMPQSLARVVLHIVFSTKNRVPFLKDHEHRARLHAYMAGVLHNIGCEPILINGVEDHVHTLCNLSRTL